MLKSLKRIRRIPTYHLEVLNITNMYAYKLYCTHFKPKDDPFSLNHGHYNIIMQYKYFPVHNNYYVARRSVESLEWIVRV